MSESEVIRLKYIAQESSDPRANKLDLALLLARILLKAVYGQDKISGDFIFVETENGFCLIFKPLGLNVTWSATAELFTVDPMPNRVWFIPVGRSEHKELPLVMNYDTVDAGYWYHLLGIGWDRKIIQDCFIETE